MRLVKRPRLSGPAATLLEAAADHVDCEGPRKERMVGCLLISVYADGRCNKTIHRPMGDGMTDTLFYAVARQGMDGMIARKIAEDAAVDVIQECTDYDEC
ncbi:hypothetical protein [Sphingomonas sp. MA1305]|uniref:hypothetical protein n=1 Tax=Sphingomonas sp. MA1305 TaxID=2479204 RepID=UPI0018E06112|nr:hypothetical protein [Sphingomonas sp. MA1305]